MQSNLTRRCFLSPIFTEIFTEVTFIAQETIETKRKNLTRKKNREFVRLRKIYGNAKNECNCEKYFEKLENSNNLSRKKNIKKKEFNFLQ